MDNCNILSWNLRGLNSSNKHNSVIDLCSRYKIRVGGFLETKMKGNKIIEFMEQKLPNWEFYTSSVTEGRILIVWRKVFVRVTILEKSNQFVHCLVKMAGQKQFFYVTFVYGLNSINGRRSLWEGLQRLSLLDKAWIILGDFNGPFSGMDRSGGNPISALELTDSLRWLEDTHVESLRSLRSFFTWTNNQNGPTRIYSKIDHVFMNETWLDLFPHSNAVLRWEVVLDHCSCVVNILPMENLGFKLFRFYNFWADHHDFTEVVMNSWRMPIQATGLRAIFLKTLRLKHRLKTFNRDNIGDIRLNYHTAKENYQEAQLQAQSHPYDFSFQKVVKEAAEAFSVQKKMFHSFLTQRSKLTWLRQGDMNTSFFHAYLKKRRAENGIASYINDQGNLVDNFPEVVSHFVEHFRGYLGSPSSATGRINLQCIAMGSKLSVDHQLMLLKPFSRKEIRDALFGISITKSPGPDGFGSGFFKVVWQDIGDEVCSAISQCFDTGCFPSELHETSLSLVPKVANPSRAIDYRPIACCSTLYKCIAKLLCSRMALVLPEIIQPNQGSFIRGRSIAHNIMIFQDLIKNYGRASTSPRYRWIMVCLRNTSYSLLMTGRVQGTHSAVNTLKDVLVEFSSATGVTTTERKHIVQEIQLPEGSFPVKYLGVPMRPTKWRHEDCEIILQKIRLRLQSWTSRHLSFAGQMQLIHSKVCLPKAYGGLGFRDGANSNRAILAKYIWAISEKPEDLWVKWINAIYLKGFNFWNYTLKSDSSWYWRKLCHIREKFSHAEILAAGFLGRFQPSKLYNSSLNQQLVGYYHAVWCKLTLPKHIFLLWQVVNAQLLTRDNLIRLHIQVTNLFFPVCGSHFESHPHLFFDCCLSKQILNIIFDWLGFIAWLSDFSSWGVWLARARHGAIASIMNLVVAAVIYSIWRNRNRCFFMAIL
ncbi:uncharacterized protein LOC133815046 [Humulus lupulus]|uniref:uncharacterized protein LOC133815046 n=1 Tax=Humulus lupulus TaxID=3486 RepID=UPI002B411845|nr:uncharacterized protein LOC133815046 [Humulus lupulus]